MANNPKHMDNLKNFKKGESGNPMGRPKELKGIKDLIAELGEDNIKAIINKLNSEALKGNLKAIQDILDRYYGKPHQTLDHKNNGDSFEPPKITFSE